MFAWLKKLFTPRPVNHVNNVELPLVDDPRWVQGANNTVHLKGARVELHAFLWDFEANYWMVVDGVRWDGRDVEAYCQAVFCHVVTRDRAKDQERSRDYIRGVRAD